MWAKAVPLRCIVDFFPTFAYCFLLLATYCFCCLLVLGAGLFLLLLLPLPPPPPQPLAKRGSPTLQFSDPNPRVGIVGLGLEGVRCLHPTKMATFSTHH